MNIKKILILMLLFIGTVFISGPNIYASTTAAAHGIDVDSTIWEDINVWKNSSKQVRVNNNANYNVGTITLVSGAFKMKNRDNELTDYFLITYKVIVTPEVSRSKYNWFFNYYGWSENLVVHSQLSQSQNLIYYSPKNMDTEFQYTAGIGLGYGPNGSEFSASATVTGTRKTLAVDFNGSTPNKYFEVEYDYMCDILHDKNYLTKETIQYGMYVVEHKKSDGNFSNSLSANMVFMVGDGHSSFLQTYVPPLQVSGLTTQNRNYNY